MFGNFLFGLIVFDLNYNSSPFNGRASYKHNKMKFVFFALAAFASVFASDKVEAQCPIRGCGACSNQCAEETLITAARLLVNDLCNIIEDKSLNQLQDLVTCKSKIQYTLQGLVGCTDSGVLNYLAGIIPLMPDLSCPVPPVIVSAVMNGKNRVVVLANDSFVLDTVPITTQSEHIFEVVGSGCELRLISTKIVQTSCSLTP